MHNGGMMSLIAITLGTTDSNLNRRIGRSNFPTLYYFVQQCLVDKHTGQFSFLGPAAYLFDPEKFVVVFGQYCQELRLVVPIDVSSRTDLDVGIIYVYAATVPDGARTED